MKRGLCFIGLLLLAGCAYMRPVKGEATFQCVITHAGRAEDCQLKEREGDVSDAQMAESLRHIQEREYKPVTFNGTPVDVKYTFHFVFRDPLPTDGGTAASTP